MIMKDIKVVAFDCDGVMFDSGKANSAYYNHILKTFNKPEITPEQFEYAQMHTVDESLAFLFKDPESVRQAQAFRQKVNYLPFIKHMEIEPGLKPLLETLKPRYKTAIATNRTDTMDRVLVEHGLEGYFDLVVSALDVDKPKPHPDSLIKILEHFKIKPHQAIYVGDSELDELASKAAGITLVAYGNRSLSADFHIKSLKEIQTCI